MSESKPTYIVKPGQPSIADRYREETVRINITIPESFHSYLEQEAKSLGIPMAEYLRRLIAADMEKTAESSPPHS